MKVGIVGLGLMGGSLGLALKEEKLISCVSGCDANSAHEQKALELGLVHEILGLDEMKRKCDIIFLAIPVEAIKNYSRFRGRRREHDDHRSGLY